MVEILISMASKVAEYLVDPIKLQFSYVFNSHHHVKDALQKIDDLGYAREKVEESVKEAIRQGDKIYPRVQEWLQTTETILQTRAYLVQDEEEASKGCFHLKSRYHLSKKAKKQGEDIDAKLKQGHDFGNTVSHPPSPPLLVSPGSSTNDAAFPSRRSIFNQIMEALRNEQTSIVGVWGMGGVGKTTLALQVAERTEEHKLFDKVVMASSISQNPIISEIQTELARTLGLRFEEGQNRSVALMNSLKNQQRILVILDDIWNKLDLGKIGIPYGDDHKGCKLLLTSREYEVVATDMKAEKVFHLPHLNAEEAWSLFKKTAGDSAESPELKATADEIVRKCEGLPVAIVTVASALKNKSMGEWKNALKELKMAKPINIRGMSDNVYSCLQLSYSHLVGDEVKSLFLLCSLLGGRRISKDHLLHYATGLNMFEGLCSTEEATNKLTTLVGKLIASSLLMEVENADNDERWSLFFDDSFVKMHDVVRDVARSIASKDAHRQYVVSEAVELREWERRGVCRNYSGISLECRDTDKLPSRLVCSELELFLLTNSSLDQTSRRRHELINVPEDFFQGVTKLRVLHMGAVSLETSPSSLGFLSNLRTLCLIQCQMEDMTIIGKMKGLQALSLAGSTIVELPEEIGQLKDLRVLDLRGCTSLKIIPRNVISSLVGLEGLSLGYCYNIKWGRDGESNNNSACLSEIKGLIRLRTLEVQVSNPSLLPADDIVLDLINLTRYSIMIRYKTGKWYRKFENSMLEYKWRRQMSKFSKNLIVRDVESAVMQLKCFSNLFKTCQFLVLAELGGISNVVYDLANENGYPQLEYLTIRNCHTIRYIFSSCPNWVPPRDTFCRLDRLELSNLPDLESVFDFHESALILIDCFGKLRFLLLTSCTKLRCVMSLRMQNGRPLSFFPRLQVLILAHLPHINSFYSTATPHYSHESMSILFNQQEEFLDLEILTIENLKGVVEIWQGQFPRVSFSKLRVLKIGHCPNISVVISNNMVQKLYNLEELEVSECGSVKEVIQLLDDEPTIHEIDFTRLKRLHLHDLPKLRGFCSSTCTFRFPSLEKVTMSRCPEMEFFCKGDFQINSNGLKEAILRVLDSNTHQFKSQVQEETQTKSELEEARTL